MNGEGLCHCRILIRIAIRIVIRPLASGLDGLPVIITSSTIVSHHIRVHSLNNVPSQVRTKVVPEVQSARRYGMFGDFGRF